MEGNVIGLKGVCISLFFTRGVALQTWENVGMFDREVALYRRLQERGIKITFVTYGGKPDLDFAKRLPGIRIICNQRDWDEDHYIQWVTSSRPWLWSKPQIIKSNQFSGAEVALTAAKRMGSKFVARGGYLSSFLLPYQDGLEAQASRSGSLIEKDVLPVADKIVVTTSMMARQVMEKYGVAANRVVIIPNYVMTDIFTPDKKDRDTPGRRLCFIGRLEEQKNLFSLLSALKDLEVELDIVGSGSLREGLEDFAVKNGLRVNFLGNIPNFALPEVIHKADIYIQPSLYEGHPKTIIEAMSCGAAVIAGDSAGIRDLISHRQNGYLCSTTPEGIRSAVLDVLSDPDLRHRMGDSARQYAIENFSLDKVVEIELKLYEELMLQHKEQNELD
jgi:glycosyltransferase involved in cell wall biosynthesis